MIGRANGSAPIEIGMVDRLRGVSAALEQTFNSDAIIGERKGFLLLVFPTGTGKGGRCNYSTNVSQDRMIEVLEAQIAQLKLMAATDKEGRA